MKIKLLVFTIEFLRHTYRHEIVAYDIEFEINPTRLFKDNSAFLMRQI